MLHVVGEEVAALLKSPAPLAAGAEQNGQGKVEIYHAISTRKAATNNRFHDTEEQVSLKFFFWSFFWSFFWVSFWTGGGVLILQHDAKGGPSSFSLE